MSNINREELYLGALLEGISIDNIAKTFKTFEGIDDFLTKANKYASAGKYQKGDKQDFVLSPFENLRKSGKSTFNYKFKPQTLNLSNNFFPQKGMEVTKQEIANCWNEFEKEFNQFAVQDNQTFRAETTLALLQKYAVTIPNPTCIHPEVSWYDYTKIKAGLAVCIHDYLEETQKTEITDEESPLLIIRADVSGIQDFIGSIASKNASKNLKGRSFYVQLLVDTVLKLMLKKLHLFEGNVMYASGGNFFVIAPNTQFVKTAFCEFEEEITKAIFDEHKTRIAVVMGNYPVTQAQILDGKIDEAIVALFTKVIDKKKKQKFSTIIKNDYDKFFNEEFGDNGGEQILDAITGEEIDLTKSFVYEIDGSNPVRIPVKQATTEKDIIKETTAKQIFLGKALKGVNYIFTANEAIENIKKEQIINPCNLGLYYHIGVDEDAAKIELQTAVKDKTGLSIYPINSFDNPGSKSNGNNKFGFMLYGGNKAPTVETFYTDEEGDKRYPGTPKYFHELSGDGSFKRLGVLKMDIDGLGSIFKDDVKRKNLTFSYYASLSRTLDWFFKGYLNTLWYENYGFRNNTQIIYSGGDDLFIIGRWDLIIEFAEKIKTEFAVFTGAEALKSCEQITISGGMSIVTDKFPIMKAANFASDAEHDAKEHQLANKEKANKSEDYYFKKNSFSVLGKPLHWDTEYKIVKLLKNELVGSVGEGRGQIPKSLLSKIRMHAYNANQYKKDKIKYEKGIINNAPVPRWIWTVIYDFSQLSNRLNGDNEKLMKDLQKTVDKNTKEMIRELFKNKDLANELSKSIFTNTWKGKTIESKYHFLELLSFAARWAELEIRS